MSNVFVLHHGHVYSAGDEDVKLLGVYGSRANALAAAGRFKTQPGFCDLPNIVEPGSDDDAGFHITEYTLDEDSSGWASGYVRG